MNTVEQHEETASQRLSTLLKACRGRIRPECRSLGQFERVPARVGRPVTQEEIAEAAGIGREWYARMETDRPVRASSRAIVRVAEALMMDPAERMALFRLTLPEMRRCDVLERRPPCPRFTRSNQSGDAR